MAEDMVENIKSNANAPKRVAGGTGSMEQHTLPEQIAAAKFVAADKAANGTRGLGIRSVRLVPPGVG